MMWGIIGGIMWLITGIISAGMLNYYLGPFKKGDFDSISMFLYWEAFLVFTAVFGGPFVSFSVICINLMVPKENQRWGFKL